MIIPFCCPTCGGQKTVSKPSWIAGDQQTWVSGGIEFYPCPSCNGSGILWHEIGKEEGYLGELYIQGEWKASPDY